MNSVQDRKIRVFQVATGNVGSEMISESAAIRTWS